MEFLDFEQFQMRFSTEEACVEALTASRWPHGFRCPRCDCPRHYKITTRRHFECADCGYQVSVTAGTIMENTRTPLTKWFTAIYMISQTSGVSATALRSIIQVTYKTAWTMLMKLRYAMSQAPSSQLLTGSVIMNVAILGEKIVSDITEVVPGEHHVMIGATIDDDGEPTHILIKKIPSKYIRGRGVSPLSIGDFQSRYVDDEASHVKGIYKRYDRDRFKHLLLLVKQTAYWIHKTFIAIGAKHLQAYLDEFSFRYNEGKGQSSVLRSILGLCGTESPMTYQDIIHLRTNLRARSKTSSLCVA